MSVFPAAYRRPLLAAGAILVVLLAALGLSAGRSGASAAATGEDDGRQILRSLADEAVRDRRVVAPAGRNAYEFYLSVLELDASDVQAHQALLDLFPLATEAVERTIDRGELDEAERELRLLRDFDSDNYLLALLAGKLDAQRVVLVRQHEARARIIQARLARETQAQPAR